MVEVDVEIEIRREIGICAWKRTKRKRAVRKKKE